MLELSALERFIDEYGGKAYNFAYQLCGNEPDAKELVQQAFVRALDKADQYDAAQPLEGWFMTLLKHIYLDGERRWVRKRSVSFDLPIGEEGLTVADALPDGEEALLERLERQDTAGRVRDAMSELTEAGRAVVTLVDMERMTYEDASQVLGWTVATVRARLNRARISLRRRLVELEVAS